MNIYRFRLFIGKEKRGKAFQFVDKLKNAGTFKKARFDVFIPKKGTEKVIVCLGQKHTVHRGRITKWGAKHIAKVQARLFEYYRYFHHKFGLTAFGAEGVIANGKGNKYQYRDDLLNQYLLPKEREKLEAEDEAVHVSTIEKILKRLSVEWHRKMKVFGHDLTHGAREIAPYASTVNGLRLYSYVAEDVIFFPIEGETAYKHVSSRVKKYQEEMIKMEQNKHYRVAIDKKGKGLTKDEYDAMLTYNELVRKFNKAIKSNYREEASLALALEQLEKADLTVFTMGIGHRTNYKWLAPRYLKSHNVAFVLVTAPELWWWKHMVARVFQILVLLAVVVGYWYFFMADKV